MMFFEEAKATTKPVKIRRMSFKPDPIFGPAPSYKQRYAILLDRLYRDDAYSGACFVTSSADPTTPIHEPVPEPSFQNFAAAIKGRVVQVLNMEPTGPSPGELF